MDIILVIASGIVFAVFFSTFLADKIADIVMRVLYKI